jgi:hypothetical protein
MLDRSKKPAAHPPGSIIRGLYRDEAKKYLPAWLNTV